MSSLNPRLSRQIIQEILPVRSLNELWVVLRLEVMGGDDVASVVFACGGEQGVAGALLVNGAHRRADLDESMGQLFLQIGHSQRVAQTLRPLGELAAKLRHGFE